MSALLVFAAVAVVAAAARPAAVTPAPAPTAIPFVIGTTVAPSATHLMTAAVWRKLLAAYAGGRAVVTDDDADQPDEGRCRDAHGLYAVSARFEGAPWLPGLARDPSRAYGLMRFAIRNCLTGVVLAPRVVAVDGDPLALRKPGDPDGNAERLWEHAVRAALVRGSLFAPVGRIVAIHHRVALVERNASFARGAVLHGIADAQGHACPPFELTVISARGRFVTAHADDGGEPRVGDYVVLSADAPVTPAPEPRR